MPRTQRTRRTRTRVKRAKNTNANANGHHTAADNQADVLEMIRNRRYVAFVRAIVGAARMRNSSR
jgi:hypothetical protein